MFDKRILLIDIDGLRPDMLMSAVLSGKAPNIARVLGGRSLSRGLQIPVLAPAPSSTFCAQASLFTGRHPKDHGIPGNQYLDRFGTHEGGRPRRIGFDVGDITAVDDAFRVFTHGLAADRLQVPTLYEKLAHQGRTSVVAGNMYAKGASRWIKPSLFKLGLFMKGKGPLALSAADYDRHVLRKLIRHVRTHGPADVTTMYFLGVDHESHDHGPAAQLTHLTDHIDPMIGELWQAMQAHTAAEDDIFVAIFSDHGQVDVIPDDHCTLRIGTFFRKELARFFTALGRRVYRSPLDSLPTSDIFLGLNGGACHVYARDLGQRWAAEPDFGGNVLPIGQAFWGAHYTGTYLPKLRGAVAAVLVRNVERDGWKAPYKALTPDGKVVSLDTWFAAQPAYLYLDPVNRLDNLAGPMCGDLLIIPDYESGYYFGETHKGSHGGFHPDESRAALVYGWPGAAAAEWHAAQDALCEAIAGRCRAEGNRRPSVADMLTGLDVLLERNRLTLAPTRL